MLENNKHVFWESLLVALFILAAGILIGVLFENWRTQEIKELYQQSEFDLLDIRIQGEIYSSPKIDCDNAIKENINFADKVFWEAQLLDKYETSNKLTDSLILQHKRYDLLRVLFWMNAIKIKQRCKADYHNVVYIYDYQEPGIDKKAKQSTISRLLLDLKEKYGDKVMLIPFAGDNDLTSIRLLMNIYNITEEELPVILIDEKTKITELEGLKDIEKLFGK